MKIKLLFITLFLSYFSFSAQIGDPFPVIDVLDLNDEALTIPNDIKGKFSLIGVAFSEDAQEDLYS